MLHLYDCNQRYIGLDKVQSWLPWWLSGKESTCQCRRSGFDPRVRKILWRRKWKPTPVFLPGKSHGQKSLRGYSPWGCKTVRHILATKQQQHVVINWRDINIFNSDLENQFSSVQLLSCVQLFVTPWTTAHQASLSITNSQSLPKTHVHWVSDTIQPSHPRHPLLLVPSIFPSIRVFSNESALRIRWPKYWSFSFNISPSNELSGLIFLQYKGLSRVFSNTTVQKYQFFGAQLSLQSNSHIHTWLLEKP